MGNNEESLQLLKKLSEPGAYEALLNQFVNQPHPDYHLSRGYSKEMLGLNSEYERNLDKAFKAFKVHDKKGIELSTFRDFEKIQYHRISDDELENVKWDSVAFRQQYYNEPQPTHYLDAWEIAMRSIIEARPDVFSQSQAMVDHMAPRFDYAFMRMGLEIIPIHKPIRIHVDTVDFSLAMSKLTSATDVAANTFRNLREQLKGETSDWLLFPCKKRESISTVLNKRQRRQKREERQQRIRKCLRKRLTR